MSRAADTVLLLQVRLLLVHPLLALFAGSEQRQQFLRPHLRWLTCLFGSPCHHQRRDHHLHATPAACLPYPSHFVAAHLCPVRRQNRR